MVRVYALAGALLVFTSAHAAPSTPAGPPPATVASISHQRAANETAIYVSDMHCAGCAKKIAGRLFRVKGVMRVRTDFKTDLAIVTPQAKKQLDPKALWAAVQAAGKHPAKLVGPHGTFVAQQKTNAPQKVAEAPPAAAARGG